MKRIYSLAVLAAVALTSAGCGGGGSTSPSNIVATSRVTKQQIVVAVEQGFAAKQQGIAPAASRSTRAESLAYFNDYYQVWAQSVENGEDFFVDEALTQPAGTNRYFFTQGERGEFTKGATVEVTAGPGKGYRATYNVILDSTGLRYDFQGVHPEFGPFSTTGSTIDGVTKVQNGFRDEQGNTRYYDVEYSNGSTRVRYNNDKLFNIELNYTTNGTGTGTVTGNSELLPATITWDQTGSGTITFKDGSTQSFSNYRFEL